MKEQIKYDPEDIESLLLHKEYQELYPEERDFVLKHLADQEEYNSMRAMLLTIATMDEPDEIEPQGKTLDLLMEEFVTEEKRGFKWWLNSLFAGIFPSDRTWIRQPGFQLAMALGVVVIGFIYFQKTTTAYKNIAEAKQVKKEKISHPEASPKKKNMTSDNSFKNNEETNATLSDNNGNIHQYDDVETIMTDDKDVASHEDENIIIPAVKGLDLTQKPSTESVRNETVTFKDEISESDMEIVNDDLADMEEVAEMAEEEIQSKNEADKAPTLVESNEFVLDNQIGNTVTSTEVEEIKTSGNNTNGFEISSTKSLALHEDLIGLLYTAP